MKLPVPDSFEGGYDGKTVRMFANSLETYFLLTGISDNNTQALSAKTRLVSLACTWYDSQGCDDRTITWTTLSSYLHFYFIPSDYKRRAKLAFVACCMGNKSVTEYIDTFRKHLVCCVDMRE